MYLYFVLYANVSLDIEDESVLTILNASCIAVFNDTKPWFCSDHCCTTEIHKGK